MTNWRSTLEYFPWAWLGTIAAVWFGWFLSERGKRRNDTQFAAGPALTTLLLMRRRMVAVNKAKEILATKLALPPNAGHAIGLAVGLFLPETEVSDTEYYRAVSWLAGIDPLLAMWLRLDRVRTGSGINKLNELALMNEAPTPILDVLSEISQPDKLDESILALARLHGRKTERRIKAHMSDELERMSENLPGLDQLLDCLQQLSKNQQVETKHE